MSTLTHRPNSTIEGKPASAGASPFGQPAGYAPGPVGHAGPGDPPPRFRPQIVRSLRMHRTLAISVGVAVTLLLLFIGLRQPRVYMAQSLVYVDPIIPGGYTQQGVPGFDQFRYASYLDQQMQTVSRLDILTAALRTLSPNPWRQPNESEQAAALRLQKALVVERVLTSYEMSIKLTTANPETSAAIVNAVTDAYLQGGRRDELTQADGRVLLLSEERQRIQDELDTDRKEQASLGASLGVANPAGETGNPFDTQLSNLRTELATARQAHDVAAAQLSSVSGQDADRRSGLAAAADESLITDPGLSAMKSSVNARRAVLESQMAGLKPSNPLYRQDQDEIADLGRSLDSMTAQERGRAERRIQDKLRTELQRTAGVESQLNAQLAQQTAQATGAGPKLQRAAELATDIQRLNTRFATVDEDLHTLELQTNGPGLAHQEMKAAVPAGPEPNRRNLYLQAALPLGILCGLIAAVLARAGDRRVYLGADLEHAIGFAPIAVLPAREDVPSRVIDEYMLRLAAGVEGAYRTASARTFVVTPVSAGTETGALLQALARKLEDLRLRVLVLRASELLMTTKETAEFQAMTPVALEAARKAGVNLRGMQTGEGIAKAKLDRMKEEYDVILIDAAPLLHSAETEYAARCADATILVAESGVTLSTELANATALLARLQVTGVAAVLAELRLQVADEAFKHAIEVVEQRTLDGAFERNAEPRREQPAPDLTPAATLAPEPLAEPVMAEMPVEQVAIAETPAFEMPILPAVAARSTDLPDPGSQVGDWQTPVPPPLTRRVTGPTIWRREPEDLEPAAEDSRSLFLRPARNGNRNLEPLNPASYPAASQLFASEAGAAEEIVPAQHVEAPRMPPRKVAEPDVAPVEDAQPVGRFAGERELVATGPSYSRSKIRLAFKEHEVNSKTTWFSKLFRGDPASSFKVIPDDDDDDDPMDFDGRPIERLPEVTATADPELKHLLHRINSRTHQVQPAEQSQPIEVDLPPAPARIEPWYRAAEWEPATRSPEPVAFERVRPAIVPPLVRPPAPIPTPADFARPVRPLSFQHLSRVTESVPAAATPQAPAEAVVPVQPSIPRPPENLSSAVAPLWPAKAPRSLAAEPQAIAAPQREPAQVVTEIPRFTRDDVEAAASDVVAPQPAVTQRFEPLVPPQPVPAPYLPEEPARLRPTTAPPQRSANYLDPIPPLGSEPTPWHQRSSEHRSAVSLAAPATPAQQPAVAHAAPAPALAPSEKIPEKPVAIPGLTRRWKLLSQFEPLATDPAPARYMTPLRPVEVNPRHSEEG
jgi:uncharacterized protein involved in exopolysaccharide biosynthesis